LPISSRARMRDESISIANFFLRACCATSDEPISDFYFGSS
jgi:hypothetical protein